MTGAFGISEERWEAMIEEVAAVAEDNRRREEREAIEQRHLIYVSWYDCNCGENQGFVTKYCAEYHRVGALIPATVLNKYRED